MVFAVLLVFLAWKKNKTVGLMVKLIVFIRLSYVTTTLTVVSIISFAY